MSTMTRNTNDNRRWSQAMSDGHVIHHCNGWMPDGKPCPATYHATSRSGIVIGTWRCAAHAPRLIANGSSESLTSDQWSSRLRELVARSDAERRRERERVVLDIDPDDL